LHVWHRHRDGESKLRRGRAVDDRDLTITAEETGHRVERPHRRRQADALRVPLRQVGEPFERQREMRAALGRRQCMNLVDDHGLDRGERLRRPRSEDEIQRLGSGDQDLRRVARLLRTLALRRVARAHRDARRPERQFEALGDPCDARERGAQVALDVVHERLQRRDVEYAHAGGRGGLRSQPVDAGEKRGKCFAASRGRDEQGVAPGRDLRPAAFLHRGRGREILGEPALRGVVKQAGFLQAGPDCAA
jgi:hypothetical protein